MRVLFYLERFSVGGIESAVCNILRELMDEGGNTATVVAHVAEGGRYAEQLTEMGVPLVELSGRIRHSSNARLFKKHVEENRYDVIHINAFHGLSLRLARIAARAGIPVRVVQSHGAGLRRSRGRALKLMLSRMGRRWLGYATRLIAVSEEAGRFLFGKRDFTVIPNGIEPSLYAYSEKERKRVRDELSLGEGTVLGTVGRFSEEKNQLFLTEVLSRYSDSDAKLLLVGDGDTLPEVKASAERLGIADRVVFAGVRSDVGACLAAMDLFLFPSTAEGFGIAAVEAAASGLTVIASPAIPESALVGRHRILPLSNAEGWAEAARLAVAEVGDRADGVGRVTEAGLSLSVCTKRIIDVYGDKA